MIEPSRKRWSIIGALWLAPTAARAHAFATPYILPVPFWIYAYGCVATLIVTFALFGSFVRTATESTRVSGGRGRCFEITHVRVRYLLWLARAGAAISLVLVVLSGLIGSTDPTKSLTTTMFWALFLLGGSYATLLLGDFYSLVNPLKLLVDGLERAGLNLSISRISYPSYFGYWPAFSLYFSLLWAELFLRPSPFALSVVLLLYSAITVLGTAIFSKTLWFEHGELFSVFFRLIGKLAPIEYLQEPDTPAVFMKIRTPLVSLRTEHPKHISLVLFVLLMLSSTAYDSIHDTALWIGLFWGNVPQLVQYVCNTNLTETQNALMKWYLVYRQAGLGVFPLLYLILYMLVLHWAKVLTHVSCPLSTLVLKFCYTLLPIAVFYHFAHYFAFLVDQLRQVPRLLADPFQLGWNLLSMKALAQPAPLPMSVVWHTQVGAILAGHVGSIYLAHIVSLTTLSERRPIVSQLPLLALMMVYTIFGLHILSLPLGAG